MPGYAKRPLAMRYLDVSHALQSRRIESIDALRGFNMFWLMGIDGAMLALGEMTKNKGSAIGAVGKFFATQFTHVYWEGLRFYDFIFPLFIFVTGVSIVLSLPGLVEREGRTKAHLRALRRAVVLYVLGLVAYGGISQHWADVRLLGVLQRIGLCYFFASLLFLNLNLRGMVTAVVLLLVGYWALMTFVPVPGIGAGSYAPDANLANWIDHNYLPGRLWDKTRDPEGMLSTLPAIATCLLGVLAGLLLRDTRLTPEGKTLWLIAGGCVLLAAGYLWALQFPIIKALWTSSFVLVTAGYSAILLGIMHQVVDIWGFRRWVTVFVWIGANAITLYFLNDILDYSSVAARFVGGDFGRLFDRGVADGTGAFATHALGAVFAVMLARFMYRRKVFVRV